jgi:hypothetical protein
MKSKTNKRGLSKKNKRSLRKTNKMRGGSRENSPTSSENSPESTQEEIDELVAKIKREHEESVNTKRMFYANLAAVKAKEALKKEKALKKIEEDMKKAKEALKKAKAEEAKAKEAKQRNAASTRTKPEYLQPNIFSFASHKVAPKGSSPK